MLVLCLLLSCIFTQAISIKFRSIRRYLPFGMIAGLLFLILKQSFQIQTQPGINIIFDIFLCFSFSAMALESKKVNFKAVFEFNDLWFYSILQFISQWSLAIIFCLIYTHFFELPAYLSSMFPIGFAGGYGSAATAGAIYQRAFSMSDAIDLFMFASTIGLILSIAGSIILVRMNGSEFFQDNSRLPKLRQTSLQGMLIIILVSFTGMLLSYILKEITGRYIPGFAIAFILANIFKHLLIRRVQKEEIVLTSYISSELLVIFGIGFLNLKLINHYLYPILALLICGTCLCLFMYFFVAKRILKTNVFERSVFTWGWSIGGIIIALSTIQSLNSSNARATLRDYMQIYLFIAPFEISILFLSPNLLMSGNAHILLAGLLICAILFWQLIYKRHSKALI